jgi:putative toxin-antitoxin system antitoxin component (TIGR02293 family)
MSGKRFTYSRRMESLLAGSADRGIREAGAWHERILGGLEFEAAERVKAQVALTDLEFAKLLGISEATLRRARAAGGTLDAATSDRLYRLTKVLAVAEEVLESSANAGTWLRRAQPALGGRVPLDLLVTQAGADEVETLLRRIDLGVYT